MSAVLVLLLRQVSGTQTNMWLHLLPVAGSICRASSAQQRGSSASTSKSVATWFKKLKRNISYKGKDDQEDPAAALPTGTDEPTGSATASHGTLIGTALLWWHRVGPDQGCVGLAARQVVRCMQKMQQQQLQQQQWVRSSISTTGCLADLSQQSALVVWLISLLDHVAAAAAALAGALATTAKQFDPDAAPAGNHCSIVW